MSAAAVLAEVEAHTALKLEIDGGLVVQCSGPQVTAVWAWQRTATGDLSVLRATDKDDEHAIAKRFARSAEAALVSGGVDAAARMAADDVALWAVWQSVLTGAPDDGALSVLVVTTENEAPPVVSGVAPIRVGRYHYGAEHRAPKSSLRILERDVRTPYAELRDIGGLGACAEGDLTRAQQLVASGWEVVHAVDKFGSNALMWSASYGRLEVARWLLSEVGLPVDAHNKVGRTALMFACKYAGQVAQGHALVRYLLDKAHADVRLRMRDESAAFDWAVFGGHRPTMELLASHPDVDVAGMNRFGCAAVQWAAAAGNVDTLRWLQEKGLSLSHVNGAGHGAVVKAAWKGHDDALHWLLVDEEGPRLRKQLASRDPQGRSVAELAALNGMEGTARWLAPLVDEAEAELRDGKVS